jgi:hypothetical protein
LLSPMSFSTCALGSRILSRTGVAPPPAAPAAAAGSEEGALLWSGEVGAEAYAWAGVREERSEVERHVSMSDSSRSRAPTWRLRNHAQRMLPAVGGGGWPHGAEAPTLVQGTLKTWLGSSFRGAGEL